MILFRICIVFRAV